jgi:hypothetical protein
MAERRIAVEADRLGISANAWPKVRGGGEGVDNTWLQMSSVGAIADAPQWATMSGSGSGPGTGIGRMICLRSAVMPKGRLDDEAEVR